MTIDEYINYINPPAVHKFQNAYEESILCVKYEDRISLRSGHISEDSRHSSRDNFTYRSSSIEECPEGSVPIIEITRERVERAGSVRQYLNKRLRVNPDSDEALNVINEFALVEMREKKNKEIHEMKAVFNLWQPSVEFGDSLSSANLWVYHAAPNGSADEGMAAGLMV
ncbi:hypothetical protein SUGI_0680030 [Cryptomeria japonica]|nr:hypothetical protein SUGI_0680030 [Cryptomeria japonica]